MAERMGLSGNPLDRADHERRDAAWLEHEQRSPAARFLPVWRLQPLVKTGDARSLAWARWTLFEDLQPAPEVVLLGTGEGAAHFAVDVSRLEKPVEELGVEGVAAFEELRGIAPQLPADEAAIAAQARGYVDWHARHRHCAACGGTTRSVFGGAQRNCIECAAQHFPRTDPVVIALVSRGERCLLGRGHGWPGRMYSALAGYVSPGETLEEAVRREVEEECGVRVGAVRYLASQPWPFPASLMIGFLAEAEAEAESEEIRLDHAELADARWFPRDAVRRALAGTGEFDVPPAFAIAHHLIRSWAEQS